MASIDSATAVEKIIGYTFRNDYGNLFKALTAAGAVEEDWDGNRKLAQFGTSLSEFLLNYVALEAEATREDANNFRGAITNNKHRASIAIQTGISRHIRFSEREGAQSLSVLAKALNAIIAAVFLDCRGDIGVVLRTMRHLGYFTPTGQSVNPTMLSLVDCLDSLDVGSLARSLFNVEVVTNSSSIPLSNDSISPTSLSIPQYTVTSVLQEAVNVDIPKKLGHDVPLSTLQRDLFFNNEEATLEEIDANQQFHERIQGLTPIIPDAVTGLGHSTVQAVHPPGKPARKQTGQWCSQSKGRKRLREHHTHTVGDMFGTYLAEEEQKCQDLGHQAPQDTFLTADIQQEIQILSKDKTVMFAKMLMQISSPCLIGGIQAVFESHKDRHGLMAPRETTGELSRVERFQLIADLDKTLSLYQLLRRYHILTLFRDCKGPEASISEMMVTPADFVRSSSKRGNPVNRSIADVTTRMMQDMFPSIKVESREYKSKERSMARIRRLGLRLHMLETRFGEGTLGLILDQGLAGTDIGITDAMIMAPTDTEYVKFIDVLEKSQGELLRSHSRAILPAVRALTVGPFPGKRTFRIENMTMNDFTKYPKGSPVFLRLISDVV